MKKILLLFSVLFLVVNSNKSIAQTTDLVRIEYTYFPQSNSDNSFRRFRSFVNFPIELKKKGTYIIPGIEYRNVNFKYEDPAQFETLHLDRFQSFTASLGTIFNLRGKWRMGAEVGVKAASNFSTNDIYSDDLIFDGAVYFIRIEKEAEKPWRLIFGMHYSTTTGFPFPLPVVNYYKKFNPNWSYTLGIPKSNLKYHINKRNELQTFITLDGFFANIQDEFEATPVVNDTKDIAESMSMTILLAGIGYQYNFSKHISFYIYTGHTLINDIRLRDSNKDDVYTINDTNTFYSRGGLKFSIL
ncbi:DUF6268 family outer membrane beta-barrel protein [Zunongwangia sp.]|uniref:DUF6268 family outer membrane beta-barrel protein n=1 Tax=Zunongwangia sp. TaxID=1965325 RepID=UPI003AA97DF1